MKNAIFLNYNKNYQFITRLSLNNKDMEVIDSTGLLGTTGCSLVIDLFDHTLKSVKKMDIPVTKLF